uniref:EF-hand domain-containing protein n=1 Tax=Trichuris muris TaxID=70415 RepID=A0A5S6QWV1_TRIMR
MYGGSNRPDTVLPPSHFYQLSTDKEAKLRELYNELDIDGDGRINFRDLVQALKVRMPGLSCAHSYAMHVMEEASASHGEPIEFAEFVHYVLEHEKRLSLVFEDCDRKKDGILDSSEVMHYLDSLGVPVTASQAQQILQKMGSEHGGGVALDDFLNFFMFYPCSYPREMANHWRHNLVFDIGEDSIVPEEFSDYEFVLGAWWQHLVAGAAAGSVSRTCTAPLDRVKEYTGFPVHASVRNNVRFYSGLRMLIMEGGLKGMWRGNGVNVLKIAPESAIKFMVYEQVKKLLKSNNKDSELTMFERIISGSLAGSIAQTLIYPLEVLKTRLALRKTGQMNRGIIQAFSQIYQKEGLKAFYRGFIPNFIGIIPYAGIDLAAYETFKANYVSRYAKDSEPPVLVLMACGTASSICGQLASYPFSLVRTRLQAGARSTSYQADRMTSQFRYILQNEGFTGLYRGLTPNFMKVLPSVCISYVVYETVRKQLGATMT